MDEELQNKGTMQFQFIIIGLPVIAELPLMLASG